MHKTSCVKRASAKWGGELYRRKGAGTISSMTEARRLVCKDNDQGDSYDSARSVEL